jgi:hypothetical protein
MTSWRHNLLLWPETCTFQVKLVTMCEKRLMVTILRQNGYNFTSNWLHDRTTTKFFHMDPAHPYTLEVNIGGKHRHCKYLINRALETKHQAKLTCTYCRSVISTYLIRFEACKNLWSILYNRFEALVMFHSWWPWHLVQYVHALFGGVSPSQPIRAQYPARKRWKKINLFYHRIFQKHGPQMLNTAKIIKKTHDMKIISFGNKSMVNIHSPNPLIVCDMHTWTYHHLVHQTICKWEDKNNNVGKGQR